MPANGDQVGRPVASIGFWPAHPPVFHQTRGLGWNLPVPVMPRRLRYRPSGNPVTSRDGAVRSGTAGRACVLLDGRRTPRPSTSVARSAWPADRRVWRGRGESASRLVSRGGDYTSWRITLHARVDAHGSTRGGVAVPCRAWRSHGHAVHGRRSSAAARVGARAHAARAVYPTHFTTTSCRSLCRLLLLQTTVLISSAVLWPP
ncbi:hypothetical protein ZWY2020_035191 [Hordeum vulgare]|nr:hypothetical protein ZWY2020_035191 [Hordeum vulgare]